MSSQFPEARPRRLRRNASLRSLFQETEFSLNDLVLPIFVEEEIDDFVPIKSMPGVMRIPERSWPAKSSVMPAPGSSR
jgi:porphobilinogen synthase